MFSSLISSSSSDPGGGAPGLPAHDPSAAAGTPPSAASAAGAGAVPAPGRDSGGGDPFGLFRDVSCPVEVVLGTGQISLRRCLALERGSVVRLHQSAGEDLQVVVNGVRIAHAEVVIIDETVGVRVTYFAGTIGREKRL
jgi:flagellar motor switch protein FliN/FliY